MVPCLTSLHPEIRNMIWEYLVVSPTGYVHIVSRQDARLWNKHLTFPKSHMPSGPNFYVVVDRDTGQRNSKSDDDRVQDTLPISLLRTCRLIYIDTALMFWERNTFVFKSPHHYSVLYRSLKFPFRRLTSIRLWISQNIWSGYMTELQKAMQTLSKEANREGGCLQHLEVEVTSSAVDALMEWNGGQIGEYILRNGQMFRVPGQAYEGFLRILRVANKELPNVNKTLVIAVKEGRDMSTMEERYLKSGAGTAARGGNLDYESLGGHTAWPGRIE